MLSNSILEARRKYINEEYNTAQADFERFLGYNPKNTDKIMLLTAISGELDLSVIQKKGFVNLKEIYLGKGDITSIKNIPRGIKVFKCEGNLLVTLNDLPPSLEELELESNFIHSITLQDTPHLKILNLNENDLKEIDHLPITLEKLYLNNNKLRVIDLNGLDNLKTLHCENNPISGSHSKLIVKNVPKNLVDMKMNNYVEEEEEDEREQLIPNFDTETRIQYQDAVFKYFELKQKYEKKATEMKKREFNKASTKKKGRENVLKVKIPCINCKRPVGSVFRFKDNKYQAFCGDKNDPCKLSINIFCGNIDSLEATMYDFRNELERIKQKIIEQKMDTLFNYMSENESANAFNYVIEDYQSIQSIYTELHKRYTEYYHGAAKKEEIKKKTEEIYKLIGQMKNMLNEYQNTGNKTILNTAITLQVNDIEPEVKRLTTMKYPVMEMVDQTHLFQYNVPLEQLSDINEAPRVIKYEVNK